MNLKSNSMLVLLSMAALAGACSKDESEDTPKKKPASASATATPPPPVATSAAQVVPDSPPPAAGSFAKGELDGKEPDAGWAGQSLAVGKIVFTAPKDWAKKAGDFTTVTASDGAGRFAAGKYPDGAQATGSMDAAIKALGLTDCSWTGADNISLGKDKIPAQTADGNCKRDGKPTKAAYVAISGKDQNVLAVGAWDDGKEKPVMNTFRSARVGQGGGSSIAACCQALEQNSVSAPLQQKGAYIAAAGACRALMNNPQTATALAQIHGMLAGAGVPPACR